MRDREDDCEPPGVPSELQLGQVVHEEVELGEELAVHGLVDQLGEPREGSNHKDALEDGEVVFTKAPGSSLLVGEIKQQSLLNVVNSTLKFVMKTSAFLHLLLPVDPLTSLLPPLYFLSHRVVPAVVAALLCGDAGGVPPLSWTI